MTKMQQCYSFERTYELLEGSVLGKKFTYAALPYSERPGRKLHRLQSTDGSSITFFSYEKDDGSGHFLPIEQLKSILRFLHKYEVDYLDEHLYSCAL